MSDSLWTQPWLISMYIIQSLHAGTLPLTPPRARHGTLRKLLWRKIVSLLSACSGRNYNLRCINVAFWRFFLRELAHTTAKNRTNISSHRRSCRKPLDRSGPNLTHVCTFIWEWKSVKQINLLSPKGYLEGDSVWSHIHKCGKDAK